MVNHRNLILLAVVAFVLVFSIASAQAEPPAKPGNPGLPGCLAKVRELEQTIADQEATIGALQQQIDTLLSTCRYTCNGTLSAEGRWCDNLDGTIKDMNTGLIWMKNASCMSATWYDGLKWVAETVAHGVCGLTDGSYMGDWRIPTEQELYKITQGVEGVQCSQCYETSFFFVDVNSCHYWANTNGSPDTAYSIGMATHGALQQYNKTTQSLPILPVRNCK